MCQTCFEASRRNLTTTVESLSHSKVEHKLEGTKFWEHLRELVNIKVSNSPEFMDVLVTLLYDKIEAED